MMEPSVGKSAMISILVQPPSSKYWTPASAVNTDRMFPFISLTTLFCETTSLHSSIKHEKEDR